MLKNEYQCRPDLMNDVGIFGCTALGVSLSSCAKPGDEYSVTSSLMAWDEILCGVVIGVFMSAKLPVPRAGCDGRCEMERSDCLAHY